jgi:hypothetical protein
MAPRPSMSARAKCDPANGLAPTAPRLGDNGFGFGEECGIDFQTGRLRIVVELLGLAGADDGGGDVGFAQHPGECELRQCAADFGGEWLQLLHSFEDSGIEPRLDEAAHLVASGAAALRDGLEGVRPEVAEL